MRWIFIVSSLLRFQADTLPEIETYEGCIFLGNVYSVFGWHLSKMCAYLEPGHVTTYGKGDKSISYIIIFQMGTALACYHVFTLEKKAPPSYGLLIASLTTAISLA